MRHGAADDDHAAGRRKQLKAGCRHGTHQEAAKELYVELNVDLIGLFSLVRRGQRDAGHARFPASDQHRARIAFDRLNEGDVLLGIHDGLDYLFALHLKALSRADRHDEHIPALTRR